MIRRLIGLLMILSLLLPLFIGAALLLTTRDLLSHVQETVDVHMNQLTGKLNQMETTVNTATNRYEVLRNVTDQVRAAALAAAQDVASITDLTIPNAAGASTRFSLGAIRQHLQNLYNSLGSLSSALYDATLINQIPGQLGEAVNEAQGLYSDVNGIITSYGQIFLMILIALVIWMALVYVVLIYRWGRQGWLLLTGKPATTRVEIKTAGI